MWSKGLLDAVSDAANQAGSIASKAIEEGALASAVGEASALAKANLEKAAAASSQVANLALAEGMAVAQDLRAEIAGEIEPEQKEAMLRTFYEKHDKSKLETLGELIEEYEFSIIVEMISEKYGVEAWAEIEEQFALDDSVADPPAAASVVAGA